MIKFIICEDEKIIRRKTKNKVVSFMMNYDIDYEIFEFDGYDDKFYQIAELEDDYKIYILDIKTKKGKGLDAARIIREKYDDWLSSIIIMTGFPEYRYEALSTRLYLLDFIDKSDNCNKQLEEDLKIAIKTYDNRYKALKYEYNHTYYSVEYRHILCIEKEQGSKRSIIKTRTKEQIIPGTLTDVYKKLDKRFFQTHKSMIVNLDQIEKYEVKTNRIVFKNGDSTYLVSRNKKKELIEHVYNNN